MKIELEKWEVEYMRYALNEALDCCDNPSRCKIYNGLLAKLG